MLRRAWDLLPRVHRLSKIFHVAMKGLLWFERAEQDEHFWWFVTEKSYNKEAGRETIPKEGFSLWDLILGPRSAQPAVPESPSKASFATQWLQNTLCTPKRKLSGSNMRARGGDRGITVLHWLGVEGNTWANQWGACLCTDPSTRPEGVSPLLSPECKCVRVPWSF